MNAPLIEARELSLVRGGRRVLEGLSSTFPSASLTAVLGPNGSGKSSLLRALAGLLEPASGGVFLGDRPLEALSRRERSRSIAWLPQSLAAEWPFTLGEFVAQGRFPWLGAFRPLADYDRSVIAAALSRCDLSSLEGRVITELSGGELQRAFIARALAQEASLLLLDEPLSQLDLAHQREILCLLSDLACEGRTIIIALHDLNLALTRCPRSIVLSAGHLVAQGASGTILTGELVSEVWGLDAARVRFPFDLAGEGVGREFLVW